MGGMTLVAPARGLPFGSTTERVRRGVACASCGADSVAAEPFCPHCGARVVIVAEGRRPADVAATRSLQLAALVVAANAVVGGITFAVVYLVSDAAHLIEAALFLEGIKLLVVGVLATSSIRLGIRGLRDTADGQLRRRGWAIAGIIISGVFALLLALSFTLVLLLALGR